VLLIGADQYARIETWHRWQELFSLARLAVFARPGETLAGAQCVTVVPMSPLDISSTSIRARIAAGDPPRGLLPDAVLDYIQTNRLYSSPERRTR
jgi:nicotinate-nucleotide adenylyltransferase